MHEVDAGASRSGPSRRVSNVRIHSVGASLARGIQRYDRSRGDSTNLDDSRGRATSKAVVLYFLIVEEQPS